MSEHTIHSLTSIGTNKKDKKCKTTKKTVRIEVTLGESNEEACPELSYRDLLISAERKKKGQLKKSADGDLNGFEPGLSAEDEELVRRLEAKYGDGGKKKLGRLEDFTDLGAGYDETDPFIDNTDAIDEFIPDKMTTAHGGFYINSGALEFKGLSDQSDTDEPMAKVNRRVKRVLSIADDEDDVGDKDDDKANKEKKKSNGIISVAKKSKTDLTGESKEDMLKKRKLSQDRELLKKKKKRAIDDLIKKKSATVKDLLKEKRETLEMCVPISSPEKPQIPASTTLPPLGLSTSMIDIIESVASGAKKEEPSVESRIIVAPKSPVHSNYTSSTDESQDVDEKERKEDTQLPDNLPDGMKEMIESLVKAAKTSAEGKCKFFSTEINLVILRLEQRCSKLSPSVRQLVYTHLAFYLPCTKDTLMKRAKKVHLKHEEEKMKEPMRKLKAAVEAMMPAVMENYTKESQRVVEEKSTEEASSLDGDGKPSATDLKIPRKKFPWSKELLDLLCEIVGIKVLCLELIYSRKETVDKNLQSFLDKEVKVIWPPGWMTVAKLLQESEKRKTSLLKPKKPAPAVKRLSAVMPASPSVSASTSITISAVATPVNVLTARSKLTASASPLNGTNSSPSSTVVSSYKDSSQSAPISEPHRTVSTPKVERLSALDSTIPSKPNHSVDRLVSKTLDLSNGVNRTTTVIVPNSHSANLSPEKLNDHVSRSVPSVLSQSPMSLLKIPDSISVTPTALAASPPAHLPDASKLVKPAKKRIRLLDASTKERNDVTPSSILSAGDGMDIIDIIDMTNDTKKLLGHKDKQQINVAHAKPVSSKKKKHDIIEPLPEVVIASKETPPVLLPVITEKEETDAATNYISQIIHESFVMSHNSTNHEDGGGFHQDVNHIVSRRLSSKESKKDTNYSSPAEHFDKKKKKDRRSPVPVINDEESVKLECDRVMNLLGKLKSGKTEQDDVTSTTQAISGFVPSPSYGAIASKQPAPSFVGFQDEFQKHLFQHIPDAGLVAERNKTSGYSLINPTQDPSNTNSAQARHDSNNYKMPNNYVHPSVSHAGYYPGSSYSGKSPSSTVNSNVPVCNQGAMQIPRSGLLPNGLQYNPAADDPVNLLPAMYYGSTVTGNSRQSPSS